MSRRWFFVSLVLVVVAVVTALALRPPRPNLLIVTVSSWRADAMRAEVMPEIVAAARSGRQFLSHRAVSAWSGPNLAALLGGQSPFDPALPPVPPGRGATAGLASLGDDGWLVRMATIDPGGAGAADGGIDSVLPWLARRAIDRRPFAVWTHYAETRPVFAPGDDAAAIAAGHDARYRRFDQWFGRIWRFLHESGLAQSTIVLITADQGSDHLDHGDRGDATSGAGHLFEEVVRVPLILWLPPDHPDRRATGVETIATDHLRVMPSLLRLMHNHRDQAGGLLDPDPSRSWLALTTRSGRADPGPDGIYIAARIEGGLKQIIAMTADRVVDSRRYDLAADPGETTSLDLPSGSDDGEAALAALVRAVAPPPPDGGQAGAPERTDAPVWVWPPEGVIHHADIANRARLEWSGAPDGHYRVEYEAGEGAARLTGTFDVTGTVKDFGAIDAEYWTRDIVPHGVIRARIGHMGAWSAWREIKVEP